MVLGNSDGARPPRVVYPPLSLRSRQAVEASVNELLQTWDSKVPTCEGTATKGTGRYAMLCHFHTEEARKNARLSSSNGDASAYDLGHERDRVGKASHEFRAAGLVALGKQLDEAMAACEQAPIKLEEARRRWDRAVAVLADEICPPMHDVES
jgi:hypothetical protein